MSQPRVYVLFMSSRRAVNHHLISVIPFFFSHQVDNPSTPNDEGITPLHNAVCAGHHHIVKFLLDFGVNVNAADSDGW